MKRKSKSAEPSLRDKLSAAFLAAFQSDFEANGVNVIEQLREKHPDRYADIAAKLIAQAEPPPDPRDLSHCKSMEDIGIALLRGIGIEYPTEEQIQAAIQANDRLMTELEMIAAVAVSQAVANQQ